MKRSARPLASRSFLALGVAMTLVACASYTAVAHLGDGRFGAIRPGHTRDEVRRLAGEPGAVSISAGQSHWIYPFMDAWGMHAVYDVAFDADGRVARTCSLRVSF